MAEAVVSFAAKEIGNLLIQEAKFLYGVRDQVEDLLAELRQIKCFLKDADARQDEHETICNLVVDIRELAYDAENVVATFVLKVAPRERRRGVRRILMRSVRIFNELIARHQIGSEIITIKSKITVLKENLRSYGPIALTVQEREGSSLISAQQRRSQLRRTYSHVVDDDFVGFEKDVMILVAQLVSENAKCHKVVSICGMGGLGKTTLAKKVYHHPNVKRHFDAFAWVSISQQWQLKDVLQRILTKLIPEKEKDIVFMIEDVLVKLLFQVQQQKKCLVVLDDIWSSDAWDCFSPAFPSKNTSSKIILTTRNKNVTSGYLHELKCLSKTESWKLFEKKAFPKADTDTEFKVDPMMEKLGMEMVEQCGGLPLAIVVLGGLLGTKLTSNHWQNVQQNFGSYPKRGEYIGRGQDGRILDVLALSYENLPYQLKACFLYLANYPEDFDIDAETLYQLWIAEGFISQEERGEEETMMDVAERYMGELAQRCMVQVELQQDDEYSIIKESRRVECCRLHDLMRDLCLSKAKEENFLQVIDYRHRNEQVHSFFSSMETSTRGSHCSKIHRLAINLDHNNELHLFKLEERARHIQTILLFIDDMFDHPFGEQLTYFSKYFKFLRVYNFVGTSFREKGLEELPKEIGNLILLKYLGLNRTAFTKLPSSIGNLRHLQTLDLKTCCVISVPNVLWKMEGLVHLYFPYYAYFSTEGKLQVDGLRNLETLEGLASDKVDVRGLFTLTNLRKLKRLWIEGKLEDLAVVNNYILNSNRLHHTHIIINIQNCDFRSEDGLSLLRQLLRCVCLVKLNIRGIIGKLPQYEHHLCPSLTSLLLSNSELKEEAMATLEKLPNLRTLYLNNAFVGKEMVLLALGFPHLNRLTLVNLEIEEMRVDDGAIPNLSFLQIHLCKKLMMLPNGLRFISTLQELRIGEMPKAFNDRLRKVDGHGEDFQKFQHIPCIRFTGSATTRVLSIKEGKGKEN